jgi:DNA-binding NarL/FixJ family response regulator
MKVLIAEGSSSVREGFARLVSNMEGVRLVGKAQDIAEARILVRQILPDLAILDVGLSSGSGMDLLKQIKKDLPDCIVFMITDFPHPFYRRKCLEAGAEYFFDKFTELDKLLEELRNVILRLYAFSRKLTYVRSTSVRERHDLLTRH